MLAGPSLNDFVCSHKNRLGDCQPERLRGLHVDDQLDLGRLFDGDVPSSRALENLGDVISGAPKYLANIWTIRDQGAFGQLAVPAQHREPIFFRELCDLMSVLKEELAWYQGDGSGMSLTNQGKGGFESDAIAGFDGPDVEP